MGKVLVACEYSGIVRDAFRARGHDAISCDLRPTLQGGPHAQGDVRLVLQHPWDLVIAHPPCNYLTHYLTPWKPVERFDDWPERLERAVLFFNECMQANAPCVAVENPPILNRWARKHIPPADQSTDFCHFGDPVKKRVGLWLRGLPPLMHTFTAIDPTPLIEERGRQISGRTHYRLGRSRYSQDRSAFQPGIAAAMADQWGALL